MITKNAISEEARRLGFDDVGFTTAEAFSSHQEILAARGERYAWTGEVGLNLHQGADPKSFMPEAKSIVVLLANYCGESFPSSMIGLFGRCYLDDDRITKNGLSRRFKAFRTFLTNQGIKSAGMINLPQRIAAARAGLGDFGKNCFLYAKRSARGSSWVLPLTLLVDIELSPDEPSVNTGCPSWCRNACIAACPTGALTRPGDMDPRKCTAYLTYYAPGLTDRQFREPMGMWIYGCDRCQEVCPRNAPWLNQALPVNERVAQKAPDFDLLSLLKMDQPYFEKRIWPHMFYISQNDRWRWQMNAARAMGNARDPKYLPVLIETMECNDNQYVRAMTAWAIGRIGGIKAEESLKRHWEGSDSLIREEIALSLESRN